MTPHTPGPWKINDHSKDEDVLYIEAAHAGVASVFTDSGNDIETDRANAALIVAAPELLNLIRGAWHTIESILAVRDGIPDDSLRAMSSALRAVINRAEGRS